MQNQGKDAGLSRRSFLRGAALTGLGVASVSAAVLTGCAFNSQALRDRGVPDLDPIEYYQNYMTINCNYPNPDLIMKFCQNVGSAWDRFLSGLSDADMATMTTPFFSTSQHQLSKIGAIKFFPTTASFFGDCTQTQIQLYNRESCIKAGAEFHSNTDAQHLVKDGDAVSGVVATDADGNYVKFNATVSTPS